MSPELIAILVTGFSQSVMLIAAIVMVYRQGKMIEQLSVNDRIIVLQNRRIEDVIKETNALMRDELLKGTK